MSRVEALEVGLGVLSAQTVSGSAVQTSAALTELIEHSVLAEEVGFDSLWLSEHHFAADGYLPSPLVVMAALARETSRIRLSTNVAVAPLYDPIRLAEDCAVLDHLSGRRMMIGLGLGYREMEFEAFGSKQRDRVSRLVQAVTTMRKAWADEQIPVGRSVDGASVRVRPLPLTEGGPPILVGAFAKAGVRRAAELADGWIAPELAEPAQLIRRIGILRPEAIARPFHVVLTMNAFVAPSDAWKTVEPGYELVNRQYRQWMSESRDSSRISIETARTQAFSGQSPHFVVGTPEECVEQLLPWCTVLASLADNVTPHITLRCIFPGISPKRTRESIRLLGEEVIPTLRRRLRQKFP